MVVVLSGELSKLLVAPMLHYADRNLAAFSAIDQVELVRGSRKAVFSRTGAGWKMTDPLEAGADGAMLDDLITSMQRLRADEIVAEKAGDLKKYGLDQPVVQWRFKAGDTEQLHLLVGAPENDKPGARRYAKLGDKQLIFLLSPKLSAKVQMEARDRAPWSKFPDSVGIMWLVHKGKTTVFIRKDSDWQVKDDPAKKIDERALGETVSALESLKVLYYVADAKADLQKFGLAEPIWKIALEAGNTRRELWIGDLEPKTKRRYAGFPVGGAVFVLDEMTSALITRELEAFLTPAKKD
jgi:hypothetical protein